MARLFGGLEMAKMFVPPLRIGSQGPPSFRPFSHFISPDPYVSDFISPDRTWNISLLSEFFLLIDVKVICAIPLTHSIREDRPSWFYDKHGFFSVKSAYIVVVLRDSSLDPGPPRVSSLWPSIWNLNVPKNSCGVHAKIFLALMGISLMGG